MAQALNAFEGRETDDMAREGLFNLVRQRENRLDYLRFNLLVRALMRQEVTEVMGAFRELLLPGSAAAEEKLLREQINEVAQMSNVEFVIQPITAPPIGRRSSNSGGKRRGKNTKIPG